MNTYLSKKYVNLLQQVVDYLNDFAQHNRKNWEVGQMGAGVPNILKMATRPVIAIGKP